MKQAIKNKLLLIAGILCFFLGGAFVGYSFANKECEPCQVGFASVDDMMFLVNELKECEGFSRYDL
jgi:hypothetical protein